MQAGAVLARQRDRQLRGLDARFARTDQRMLFSGDVIAPAITRARLVGIDHRRIFAVGDDRRGCVAEDRIEGDRVVHQHVAGGGAHEHLDAGSCFRIQTLDVGKVVVGCAEIERVVHP